MLFTYKKPSLSIKEIGNQRFYLGTCVGIIVAISIWMFSCVTRESLRYVTGIDGDLIVPEPIEYQFYNYFFASISSVLGFVICLLFWLGGKKNRSRKNNRKIAMARAMLMFTFWLMISLIYRFGTSLTISLYSSRGYDNSLNMYEDFLWLLFMIPFVIFMQSWYLVRFSFRIRKWIFISFISCTALTSIIAQANPIDPEIINNAYFSELEEEFENINTMINYAENNYSIKFSDKTIKTLKKKQTESSMNQISAVKCSFDSDKPVSLDTILLQQVITTNVKIATYNVSYHFTWPYATPAALKKQLKLHKNNKLVTKELNKIVEQYWGLYKSCYACLEIKMSPLELRKKYFFGRNGQHGHLSQMVWHFYKSDIPTSKENFIERLTLVEKELKADVGDCDESY